MNISINLLKSLIDFEWSAEELADRLTNTGSEVEAINLKGDEIKSIISAKIIEAKRMSDSDKLFICKIFEGSQTLQIICGASNTAAGNNALFAPPGSSIPGMARIGKTMLQGYESMGMLLSESELGLSDGDAGIVELPGNIVPGTPLEKLINFKDTILELEITPNRPDCLSHIGIAREIQAITGKKLRMPNIKLMETDNSIDKNLKIEIENSDDCPRYTGRIIRGVNIAPSPLWLKALVYYLGMRPINNVVDITNYVMLELGHALHAFDYDLFKKRQIVVKRAKKGQQFVTLDKVSRTLDDNHILITDGVEAVALAGIMGGLHSEISSFTKNILLESAYFEPVAIRTGSKVLGLSSESSRRFERGADPNMAPIANDRACQLINEIAGGEILKGMVDCHPKKFSPARISINPENVNRILGSKIDRSEMQTILVNLDIPVTKGDNMVAEQPSFRPDLVREIDLIEEIARIYGYNNIANSYRPAGELGTPLIKAQLVKDKIRSFLIGSGGIEIFPLSLVDCRHVEQFGMAEQSVRLQNPLSEEMAFARPSLLYSLLPVIRRNLNLREENLFLFDIGNSYHVGRNGELPFQKTALAVGLSGYEAPDYWAAQQRKRDFFSLKGIIEDLTEYLHIAVPQFEPSAHFAFSDGGSFKVTISGQNVGYAGILSAQGKSIFDIKEDIFLAELDFDSIIALVSDKLRASDLPKYPTADRDIAILVDSDVKSSEILSEILKAGAELVEKSWIFDLYQGKNIPEGKKSLAFRLKYRHPEKTLTDDEVEKTHTEIINSLRNKFRAELRK